MVMVDAFAWQLGSRALWFVTITFVAPMAVGGALGVTGIGVPIVEAGIALSVIVLGVILALHVRAPVTVAIAIVELFAIFHGHAHGSEMSKSVAGLAYSLGFILATALLHTAGLGLGFLTGGASERKGPNMVRTAGAAAALPSWLGLWGRSARWRRRLSGVSSDVSRARRLATCHCL